MLKWGSHEDMADVSELRVVSEPDFLTHLRGMAGVRCAPTSPLPLPALRSLVPGDRSTQAQLVGRPVGEFVSIWRCGLSSLGFSQLVALSAPCHSWGPLFLCFFGPMLSCRFSNTAKKYHLRILSQIISSFSVVAFVPDGWSEACERVNSSFPHNNLELQQQGNNKFSEVDSWCREHMVFNAHRCVYEWLDGREGSNLVHF